MKSNKFWLFYSMAIAGLFWSDGVWATNYGLGRYYGECGEIGEGEGCDYPSCSTTTVISGTHTCATYGSSWDLYSWENNSCSFSTQSVSECASCASGKNLVKLSTLIDAPGNFYSGEDTFTSNLIGTCNGSGCGAIGDMKVCVTCNIGQKDYVGTWETVSGNANAVRIRTKTLGACNAAGDMVITDSYEYGCAANTCYRYGSGASITCEARTTGEILPAGAQQNGHKTKCTCNQAGGYYIDTNDGSCVACPSSANSYIYTGSDLSGTTLATPQGGEGDTGGIEECYLPSGNQNVYHDYRGRFTYDEDCVFYDGGTAGQQPIGS